MYPGKVSNEKTNKKKQPKKTIVLCCFLNELLPLKKSITLQKVSKMYTSDQRVRPSSHSIYLLQIG